MKPALFWEWEVAAEQTISFSIIIGRPVMKLTIQQDFKKLGITCRTQLKNIASVQLPYRYFYNYLVIEFARRQRSIVNRLLINLPCLGRNRFPNMAAALRSPYTHRNASALLLNPVGNKAKRWTDMRNTVQFNTVWNATLSLGILPLIQKTAALFSPSSVDLSGHFLHLEKGFECAWGRNDLGRETECSQAGWV